MKSLIYFLAAAALLSGCTPKQDLRQTEFHTAMDAFYLWRCGDAVEADYDGEHYATECCHMQDGYLEYVNEDIYGNPEAGPLTKDGTGGWHDAGDYGKYTVNAGITMGVLFYAWDHFGAKIEKAYPGYLDELRWETDFLLKMEYPDGSGRVSHKLTRRSFAPFIMPQEDHEKRYFTIWSSAATADYVAMMSMAARYFQGSDEAYAEKCLEAAKRSYAFLLANPEDKPFVQGDFSTGGYQTADPDDRIWAAAEMWETTGDPVALADLEARIADITSVSDDWDWGDVTNLGLFTYALSQRGGRDEKLLARIQKAVIASADQIAARTMADEYGCPLERFYWGCNGTAARLSVNLHIADMLQHDAVYQKAIERIAGYLLGNNVYGRSFVTGLGVNPPMHPHDRRSAADGIEKPWPGYLVGGGHTATDWVDEQEDYSRNEIAINWQAGLVYLLAARL